VRTIKLSSYFW